MSDRVFNVLFLCTGNSARSLMAESALNHRGKGRFQAFSAGSHPSGHPHPMAIELLKEMSHNVSELRSKSWHEFSGPDAAPLDFVFTVCDNARGESCPVWPGQPLTAHWSVEDPAAFEGSEASQRQFFRRIYIELERRIEIFVNLRIESLDATTLRQELERIDQTSSAPNREAE
ncbi:MAG: arsenate reductase ArsC [Deltaproteobacteria bacterium]|nr:MAG: arsenate reductase ArsC [Deltaproteobacteria bacterium]